MEESANQISMVVIFLNSSLELISLSATISFYKYETKTNDTESTQKITFNFKIYGMPWVEWYHPVHHLESLHWRQLCFLATPRSSQRRLLAW